MLDFLLPTNVYFYLFFFVITLSFISLYWLLIYLKQIKHWHKTILFLAVKFSIDENNVKHQSKYGVSWFFFYSLSLHYPIYLYIFNVKDKLKGKTKIFPKSVCCCLLLYLILINYRFIIEWHKYETYRKQKNIIKIKL